MIEDVTLNVELDKENRGLHRCVEPQSYECTMEFIIEDDEDLKAVAKMMDTPVVRVDAPSLDWDGKPFIPIDPE